MILIAVIVGAVYSVFLAPKTELRQVIPGNIGLSPTCARPIHTHDDSGTIHVETPIDHDYTLGDFFRVWGKTFDSTGIFANSQTLPEQPISTTNPLGCVTANASLIYHSHPVLTIIYKTNGPHTITMTVDGNPEPRMENYPFPRTANPSGNPINIVITYGPGIPVTL